mmetsp:Transcript_26875/g.57597  ORF Transcript_26875/g.57597 Transcript_26875/m.57597 type:complete len:277 (+) Transcript_26875:155-985(+)|eukprot:CAMPEP_0201116856 /NCGR_PEP_ID=MMETSP0850-20130426/1010_1 /ASSEMBLY_ACC=CAM_ASM_000622 /TAXON_ID=183588 /ORGANISM="Pseudo-nitzschia fraudulenta, Strain WWA7" /LENGTH=276 /DNA_ID=CAMNT_0047381041 /DNA_START=46 /DNA_END=876 /DNA_ORIENTATION=+
MKLSIGALILATSSVAAFQQANIASTQRSVALSMNDGVETDLESSRRYFVSNGAMALVAGFGLSRPAFAGGLLDEFGTDPSKISTAPKKEVREAVVAQSKGESNFEPNLRSNYYYPTNKKRYLPRIKKCNDAIPGAASMIGEGDWDAASNFANNVAEDTILPMKLYTSSLLGGGTNVKVSFAKDMTNAAKDFEKAQKSLAKAISKKDQQKSSAALEDLSSALLAYRTAGRLLGPDGGGDIPSVDEIRRAACRVQGRTFEAKVKNRDARLKDAAASQ